MMIAPCQTILWLLVGWAFPIDLSVRHAEVRVAGGDRQAARPPLPELHTCSRAIKNGNAPRFTTQQASRQLCSVHGEPLDWAGVFFCVHMGCQVFLRSFEFTLRGQPAAGCCQLVYGPIQRLFIPLIVKKNAFGPALQRETSSWPPVVQSE
jgi:hypothetical protein